MDTLPQNAVLIVEDTTAWLTLLSSLLEKYKPEFASNFPLALEKIRKYDFKVVIVDVRLEDENEWNVDGLALLQELRASKPFIKVILLTGYIESAREKILNDFPPDVVLSKNNFDHTQLRSIVDQWIEGD